MLEDCAYSELAQMEDDVIFQQDGAPVLFLVLPNLGEDLCPDIVEVGQSWLIMSLIREHSHL